MLTRIDVVAGGRNTFHDADLSMFSIVAEIPGSDNADEAALTVRRDEEIAKMRGILIA